MTKHQNRTAKRSAYPLCANDLGVQTQLPIRHDGRRSFAESLGVLGGFFNARQPWRNHAAGSQARY